MERRAADQPLETLKRALSSVVLRRGLEVNASVLPPLVETVVCCYLSELASNLVRAARVLTTRPCRSSSPGGALREDCRRLP